MAALGGWLSGWSPRRVGLALALLVLASKLLFLHAFVKSPDLLFYDPDSEGYYNLAVNLIDHGSFSRRSAPPFLPDNTRTPLYPLFVAGVFLVFGKSLSALATVQIIISAATAWLIFDVGRRVAGVGVAVTAALLFAFDLSGFVYAHAILTETLFTFVMLAAVAVLMRALRRSSALPFAAAGMLAGLAALCRPVALYFFVPAIAIIVFADWHNRPQAIARSVLFLAAFGATLSPWIVRNQRTFGVANVSGIQGVNMLLVNAAYLEADRLGIDVEQAEAMLEAEAQRRLANRRLNEAERYRLYQRLGIEKILQHPWRYAWVHLKGIVPALLDNNVRDLSYFRGRGRTFFGARDLLIAGGPIAALRRVLGSAQRGHLILFAGAVVLQLALYALAAGGALTLWRAGARTEVVVLVTTIAYLLVLTAPAGNVRFRFPAMPYIDLLAGAGVLAAWRLWERRMHGVQG